MKLLVPLILLFSTAASAGLEAPSAGEKCASVQRSESLRTMSKEELSAIRQEVTTGYAESAAEAICESSAAITYEGFTHQLERAEQENRKAGGTDYDFADLYFFLECSEVQNNLSPLAYHAFNLNREETGYLGQLTMAIIWKSIGYLDIKDPDFDRSFMDITNRVLAYAKKHESETEIEMYEDLLIQIEGFREDYVLALSECGITVER